MRVSWLSAVAATAVLATTMVIAAPPTPTVMSISVSPTQILPTGSTTVTVHGKVKAGTPSGTEMFLSGPWSATFTDSALLTQKSTYTGRVSVFVQ